MRVCLLTEGTYPYVRGGVSTWCQDLIAGLSDISFDVYALVGNPSSHLEYAVPPNVDSVWTVPLWGHESVDEYNRRQSGSKDVRSVRALRSEFIPVFRSFLSEVLRGMEAASPPALIDSIAALFEYFRIHDYDWTMRRQETWDAALDLFRSQPWHAHFMTTLEAIELVRTIYRYLIPLALELPECDVMHASVAGLCALPAIAAKRIRGTPMILTEHGVYLRERVLALARAGFPFSDRTIKKNFFSAIARAAYASSDVIAPVCEYNTNWERFYGVSGEHIRVIYNGVDEKRFPDAGITPTVPTVGAVLRIDPLKDVATMIASARTVRESIPNVRYELWGPVHDSEYNDVCRALVDELGLAETVFFMGPTKDPAAAYGASTVVALSSISEGFPFTIIEAMMCAKPVVATDVGGVREAIGPFGTVVPPKRPDRLGEALI
ncbi:MAG TPA: GT4 family glycosyltransferase PelF, partial [Candidatus Aquilonibacter sp.]|nr:GT4 family glycosyltransferase PelF [Candidatus Aquilonibacter sp.]